MMLSVRSRARFSVRERKFRFWHTILEYIRVSTLWAKALDQKSIPSRALFYTRRHAQEICCSDNACTWEDSVPHGGDGGYDTRCCYGSRLPNRLNELHQYFNRFFFFLLSPFLQHLVSINRNPHSNLGELIRSVDHFLAPLFSFLNMQQLTVSIAVHLGWRHEDVCDVREPTQRRYVLRRPE